MAKKNDKEYFSFDEALGDLRMEEEELKRLVSAGEIRAFREKDSMKFRASDIEAMRGEDDDDEEEDEDDFDIELTEEAEDGDDLELEEDLDLEDDLELGGDLDLGDDLDLEEDLETEDELDLEDADLLSGDDLLEEDDLDLDDESELGDGDIEEVDLEEDEADAAPAAKRGGAPSRKTLRSKREKAGDDQTAMEGVAVTAALVFKAVIMLLVLVVVMDTTLGRSTNGLSQFVMELFNN